MLRPLATVAPSVGHPVLFSAIQRGPVTSRSEQNVSSCRLVFFYSRRFHFVLQKNFFFSARRLVIELVDRVHGGARCVTGMSKKIVGEHRERRGDLWTLFSLVAESLTATRRCSQLALLFGLDKKQKKNKVAAQLSDFTN